MASFATPVHVASRLRLLRCDEPLPEFFLAWLPARDAAIFGVCVRALTANPDLGVTTTRLDPWCGSAMAR